MAPKKPGIADLVEQWRRPGGRMHFRTTQILLENGSRKGDHLDPFQIEDYDGLDRRPHGLLLRPRGWDKSGCAGDEIVTDLVTGPPRQRLYALACDLGQIGLLKEDVGSKFRRNPLLRSLIKETATTITMKATDSRFEILPYDIAGMWGLRPSRVIIDEMSEFPPKAEEAWTALWTASGKVANARMLIISTPGFSADSLLHRVRAMAEQNPDTWYIAERCLADA
jgi:hypothetical protein